MSKIKFVIFCQVNCSRLTLTRSAGNRPKKNISAIKKFTASLSITLTQLQKRWNIKTYVYHVRFLPNITSNANMRRSLSEIHINMIHCSARFRWRHSRHWLPLYRSASSYYLFVMNLGQSNGVHQLAVVSSLILKLKRNAKHD